MSGIAGVVNLRGGRPDLELARLLSAALVHRGPADERIAEGRGAVLVERLDQAGTAERMPEGLALDGRQSRESMAAMALAWEQRGPDALSLVDGPFALAFWREETRTLWLARDAVGVRPLYWARFSQGLAFASEIPPLLALPEVSREIATEQLAEHLSFRYVHAPRTLLRDIYAVPPGHVVRLDAAGMRLERWWRPRWAPPGTSLPGDKETSEEVDRGLERAVRRALPGDGPVAVLLSGGLDSSAVLYHARQQGKTAHAFTVSLAGDATDESVIAARVAQIFGAEHHLIRLDGEVLIDGLARTTAAMGQPLPTAAGVLQGLLYEAIAPTCRTVLSGDGGDELLGGRRLEVIAGQLLQARLVEHLPRGMRGASRALARFAHHPEIAASPAHYGLTRLIGGSAVFDRDARALLMRDPALVRPSVRASLLEPLYAEVDSDPINEILHVWQRGWLCEDSLARSDRMAAAAGLDVRFPMLDREFMALCAALPGGAKVRSSGLSFRTKWPLRRAMEGRMSPQLVNRPKRALSAPLDRWLAAEGAHFLRTRIAAVCEDPAGLFAPSELRRLSERHLAGVENNGLKLWAILLFQAWLDGNR